MKHLNKIIFLNSANVPYAEVMLDGNVHFAGTQGVGKSTVLRALLFFYNADKMKLGIQSGQKSFEEFYFRHSNSYIVYEVRTGQSAYSILLSRSQGKIVYRFIDAPYRKEWLLSKDGRVESDWIRIREHIGNSVDISAKIDTYELYRNIIFGNTHDRSHRYDKYAIVESSKYHNIPRSIQNVFLNSKLDADFVKTTIIQSMVESEHSIRLNDYRHLVADFEREFDEIDCWFKKDNNGIIVVRAKADKVIETHRLLIALEQEIKETWHQLNYAVNHTREQIPLIEDENKILQEQQRKIKGKMDSARTDYDKEHDLITKKISACDVRLSDIRKKRKYYADLKIDAIIAFVEQEAKFFREKSQKEYLLRTLEEQYKDVTEKYKALYSVLDTDLSTFDLSQKEALQQIQHDILTEREKAMKVRDNRKANIDKAYNEWLVLSDERLTTLQNECTRTDKRLSELQYWHPLKQEIDACQEDVRQLTTMKEKLQGELTIVRNDMNMLREEGKMKCERVENTYVRKEENLQKDLQTLNTSLSETEDILSRWKGSLYEWLTDNKPGWEKNIGKVVDEQQVLYAQGLEPTLVNDGSLFGISLNLDGIPVHHRTPDEYRALQKETEDAILSKKKELADVHVQRDKELETVRRSYKGKLQELKQKENNADVQFSQIPLKMKDAETRLRQLMHKEQDMVDAERKNRTEVFNIAQLNLDKERTSRNQQGNKHVKDLNSVDSDYRSFIKGTEKQLDSFRQKQAEESADFKKELAKRRAEIESKERDELKGKGADTKAIGQCRKNLEELQLMLDKIAGQKHHVIEYRKDEQELFVNESEYREEKRQLEQKDERIRQTYDDKLRHFENELSGIRNMLNEKATQLEAMKEGLKQYDQLCRIENVVPETYLQDDLITKNSNNCAELVGQMRGSINKKRQKLDDLKRTINSFNSHFGANNTFHFAVPQYDEEYQSFALNLLDFIENNKIEDFRERVSEHYNTILRSVSREVGLLMNHSAAIKGIINEVNQDFQKRNFAGVIHSIELRAEESSDRMMLLLRAIRDFTEENALSIGEVNLFSGDDRDQVNGKVVEYLKKFMKQLQKEPSRAELTLSDTFRLQFRIQENDNNTGWVERINNVGSDGTDILVKAMVNIMLINVFKTKASRKNGDFIIHCMMDEIGKLHPSNVNGILQFANVRNIYLINSSPMGYNADIYKYNYLLTKDSKSQTHIKRLMTINVG